MEQETSDRLLMRNTIQEVKEGLDKWEKKVQFLLKSMGYIDVDVDYEYGTVEVIKPAWDISYKFPLYVGIESIGISTEFSNRRFEDGMKIVEAGLASRLRVLSVLPEILDKFNIVRLEGTKKDMKWMFRKKVEPRVLEMPLREAREEPEEWKARLEELMATDGFGTVTIRIDGDMVKAIWGKGKRELLLDLEVGLRARSNKSPLYEDVVIGYKKPAFEEAVRVASMSIWSRTRILNALVDAVSSYELIWVDMRRERV
ncbi:MAG: hypothetical protein JHC26_03750 [Thermofilum sp.]|uniref:hypothetical protein n=1 Tax=Thermofilum sp. TaxID=1961369 RepID=UPI002586AB8E|nr:hypothetical protein [Thermofilum sp.]MCI4408182.1 hypothetical protein [Thermofilum sp.]